MKYKFNFGVKDKEATRLNHASTIKKVKDIRYTVIIDNNFESEVESYVFNKGWFQSYLIKQEPSQKKAKEICSMVNQQTREWIQGNLDYIGKPKSWDTAFYMTHYSRINKTMARVAKSLFDR